MNFNEVVMIAPVCGRRALGLFALFGLCGLGSGCAGSETGNGGPDQRPSPIWFELGAADSGRVAGDPVEAYDAGGTFYRVWSVVAGVEGVDFVKQGEEVVAHEGVWQVDLVDGELEPVLSLNPAVASDEVMAIRVHWGAPAGPSLVIRGELVLPGEVEPRPFGADLDIRNTSVFRVGLPGQKRAAWALTIDPAAWFASVDIAACVRSGLIPVDAEGLLRIERAERHCRTTAVGLTQGFRLDGVASGRL